MIKLKKNCVKSVPLICENWHQSLVHVVELNKSTQRGGWATIPVINL